MKRTMQIVAMAALTAAMSQPLAAQEAGARAPAVEAADEADELQKQAWDLLRDTDRWPEAARLLSRSADLRPAHDTRHFTTLLLAGRVYYHAGDLRRARTHIEQAGDRALAVGAVLDAAHAYIQAAHIALALNRATDAMALVHKAELLSYSPLLSMAEREQLRGRIGLS